MTTTCVIFDCDGTLVETELLETRIFAEMLGAEGYEISAQDALTRFRGAKKTDVLSEVETALGRKMDKDAFVATWRKRSEAVFADHLELVPGAMELVSQLRLPICIASNGPLSKMELTLRITGLQPFFGERVFSAYEVGSWKPEPGLFLHAAKAMQAAPANCLVVEDSVPGAVAGIAAGMQVLAYQPDESDPPLAEGATIIRHLSQVTQYVEQHGELSF